MAFHECCDGAAVAAGICEEDLVEGVGESRKQLFSLKGGSVVQFQALAMLLQLSNFLARPIQL